MGLSTLYEFPIGSEAETWRAAARINAEAVCLLTRRTQAYLDLTKGLAGCTTSGDFLTQQVLFWQVAQRQYLESFQSAILAALPAADAVEPAVTRVKQERPRDYMMLPEITSAPAQGGKELRAVSAPRAERLRRSA